LPKKEIIEMCQVAIRKDIGSLDDIPYQLANTVANIYYRYFNLTSDVIKRASDNPFWIPKQMERDSDILKGMISFKEDVARFTSDLKAVPDFIHALRKIDKRRESDLYQYTVDFLLDCLKYDIKDAHTKSDLLRMKERELSKAEEKEIPNLIDLLDI